MRRSLVILAWIGLLLLFFSPAYGQKAAAMVGPVSHLPGDNGDRVEIPLNGGKLPNIFMIEGDNPRLVLDFPEYGYAGGSSVPVAGGVLVQGIRIGFHTTPKQKVRVVIDLVQEPKIKWTRDLLADTNVLVISIFPVDAGKKPGQTVSQNLVAAPISGPAPTEGSVTEKNPVQAEVSQPVLLSAGLSKVKVAPMPDVETPKENVVSKSEPSLAVQSVNETVKEEAGPESAAAPAAAPVLLSVAFDNAFTQSGEMVLLQLSDFQPPVITTKEKDPPQIFCDFAGAEVSEGVVKELAAGGTYVERIRVSGEGSKVRVILDLVPGSNYDLQQVYFKEDNLFVLIVNVLKEES